MIFGDICFWFLPNSWSHLRPPTMIANMVSTCFHLRWYWAELHLDFLGRRHRRHSAVEQDLADSARWNQHVHLLCWHFAGGPLEVLRLLGMAELECARSIKDSCCSSGAVGFHQIAQIAFGLAPWSWLPHDSCLDIIHTMQSALALTARMQCLRSSCGPADGCWQVVEPAWIAFFLLVAAFQCAVHAVLLQDLSEADWNCILASYTLTGCWHACPSLLWFYRSLAGIRIEPFWFSSGFLTNRLKLLTAARLMFANSLWQQNGRQPKANSLWALDMYKKKLFQLGPWRHDRLVLRRAARDVGAPRRSCPLFEERQAQVEEAMPESLQRQMVANEVHVQCGRHETACQPTHEGRSLRQDKTALSVWRTKMMSFLASRTWVYFGPTFVLAETETHWRARRRDQTSGAHARSSTVQRSSQGSTESWADLVALRNIVWNQNKIIRKLRLDELQNERISSHGLPARLCWRSR